ncbi:MAG: PorT family protein [Lewinellaceae bacterium]|nr:PorT family protein [Saprospiraceae bacterium]MCB9338643.1 PorT family protein [Lewinellaceae bacterium]
MKSPSTFLWFIFLFCFSVPSFSQRWSVGLQAGENLSTLTGDNQNDFRLGFVGGINASHYLSKNIVLRLELNIERKGAKPDLSASPDIPDVNAVTDYSFDYLSLPLLLRYTTGKKVRWVAGGGPSFNYLLRERSQFIGTNQLETGEFRRVDIDAIVGLGAGVPIGGKFTITLEGRGIFGLRKVNKATGTATDLGRHLSWGLMAGLNYYL